MNDAPPLTRTAVETASPLTAAPAERAEPAEPSVLPSDTADTVPAVAPAMEPAVVAAPAAVPAAEVATDDGVVPEGVGILVVNLGTPDAADSKSVRRYLKQFLTDPRVIERDGVLWRLILNGVILPLRSRLKARDYRHIWNHDRDESPIKTITRSQSEKLAGILQPLGKHVVVEWAMRYANPSIASGLEKLIARGCSRILVMPLYPQYSAATTATVCDEVFRCFMKLRRQPALRVLPAYYDDPYYIEILSASLQAELRSLPFQPDVILASFHGMPKEYVAKGDPYEDQCVRTTQMLRAHLKLDDTKLMLSFQSRFGRAKWLEPATIKTVKTLAKQGVKNLVVITPGFSADCLETLEEIAVENARVFKRNGGEKFAAIPCLNDSEAGMLMIWRLAMRELKGWV